MRGIHPFLELSWVSIFFFLIKKPRTFFPQADFFNTFSVEVSLVPRMDFLIFSWTIYYIWLTYVFWTRFGIIMLRAWQPTRMLNLSAETAFHPLTCSVWEHPGRTTKSIPTWGPPLLAWYSLCRMYTVLSLIFMLLPCFHSCFNFALKLTSKRGQI